MQTIDGQESLIAATREHVIRELGPGVLPSRARLTEIAGMIEDAARKQRRYGQYHELIRSLRRDAISGDLCQRAAQALRNLWEMPASGDDADCEVSTWYACDAVNVSDLADVCTGTVNALITGGKLLVFFRSPADRDAFERRCAGNKKLAIRKITRLPEAEAGA